MSYEGLKCFMMLSFSNDLFCTEDTRANKGEDCKVILDRTKNIWVTLNHSEWTTSDLFEFLKIWLNLTLSIHQECSQEQKDPKVNFLEGSGHPNFMTPIENSKYSKTKSFPKIKGTLTPPNPYIIRGGGGGGHNVPSPGYCICLSRLRQNKKLFHQQAFDMCFCLQKSFW